MPSQLGQIPHHQAAITIIGEQFPQEACCSPRLLTVKRKMPSVGETVLPEACCGGKTNIFFQEQKI